MSFMFRDCSAITSLDLSNFNTSNVTDMQWMFGHCKSLGQLDLSIFDTSKVTNMAYMFYNCNSLDTLSLDHFNTGALEDATEAFRGCNYLTKLTLGEGFAEVTEAMNLPKGTGWVNAKDTSTVISGSGDFAVIQNSGANTYLRNDAGSGIGDVNSDGTVTIADAVLLQKWLLAVPDTKLPYWPNADLSKDKKLNATDLSLLKQIIMEQN